MDHNYFLSIIICTFNRETLLDRSLSKLESFLLKNRIEVVIVDNNSSDNSKKVVEHYLEKNTRWQYIFEAQQGLSYARNTGAKVAKGKWLLYLDDDGLIEESSLDEVARTIANYPFRFFTGVVEALDDGNIPKWFPYQWGNTIIKGEKGVRVIDNDSICGGIMIIEKDLLFEIGPFDEELGMRGKEVAYGEELHLEQVARANNISIGFNSNIILKHSVADKKKSVFWILNASYAFGRDSVDIHSKTIRELPSIIISLIVRLVKNLVRSSMSMLIKKEYYWQNYTIDNVGPLFSYVGQIVTILQRSFSWLRTTKS